MLEGYYINENDLSAYMPAEELDALTQQQDDTVTNIQTAIMNTCAMADGYLQKQYDLPLAGTYVLNPLKSAIAKIVIWDVSGLYSSLSTETRSKREKDYDSSMKWLEDIGAGKIQLLNTDTEDGTLSEADKYYFDANQRITRDFH